MCNRNGSTWLSVAETLHERRGGREEREDGKGKMGEAIV